jgi:hypothetical protein
MAQVQQHLGPASSLTLLAQMQTPEISEGIVQLTWLKVVAL